MSFQILIKWTIKFIMDLFEILIIQIHVVSKQEISLKSKSILKSLASKHSINEKLGLNLVISNVRNRMKTWKRHYYVITNILIRTKFKWDEDKKMVVITVDDLVKWNEYLEVSSLFTLLFCIFCSYCFLFYCFPFLLCQLKFHVCLCCPCF